MSTGLQLVWKFNYLLGVLLSGKAALLIINMIVLTWSHDLIIQVLKD